MVAMGALLVCVVVGLVPSINAFAGFGHPAVVTVACVLVLGYGLQITGAVDVLAQRLLPKTAGPTVSILALVSMGAFLSGFMNNVGALALLMPIALQIAAKQNMPAGKILMPLSFGSILGGMTTLIGTPPNLIVSGFRESAGTGHFKMFDFAPVGVVVTLAGIAFIGFIGWRLVPARKQADVVGFESGSYFSEVSVVEDSKAANKTLREVERMLDEAGAQVVDIVRRDVRIFAPNPGMVVLGGDILVIEVEPESLATALSSLGLKLVEDVPVEIEAEPATDKADQDTESKNADAAAPAVKKADAESKGQVDVGGKDAPKEASKETAKEKAREKARPRGVEIQEMVVGPNAAIVNRSATDIELRTAHGINLLALSRQGKRTIRRLRTARIRAGDVLLLQGPVEALADFSSEFGCMPLATRDIRVPVKGQALKATIIMALAVAATASGMFSAAVAFAAGALAFVAFNVVPLRSVYTSVDWSVIILLGAMLPVADAMATTGAADVIGRFLLENVAQGHPAVALAVILVATMLLTDFMNNAATAAVMCPIAISTANHLGVNLDPFLMAVAVGASCAFLTPIGHQNNTLILGPGGFQFGDYWRMGLPMDILVVAVAVPTLLWAWPLK